MRTTEGPKSTTTGVGKGRKGTEIETEMRQIWNGDEFRRKKRKQKRIMARQLEEIFFFFFLPIVKGLTMSNSAERSRRVRTEHIWRGRD